jgi:Fe-S-cluster containining protein
VRRRLQILGRPLDVDLEVREEAPSLLSLWEPARDAAEAIADVVRKAEALRGVTPTCSAGCSACCRTQLVPISVVEAVHLARWVDALPAAAQKAVRARFADAVRRLERAGLLDARAPRGRAAMTTYEVDGESSWDTLSRRYRELAIACPFLERDRCSVYEDRPFVCREYLATSPPAQCAVPDGDVTTLPRPVRMGDALAGAATALGGVEPGSIPLVLALEWAAHHAASLEQPRAEDVLLATFASSIVVDEG